MQNQTSLKSFELPLPSIYNPDTVGEFFTPDYNQIMAAASEWRNHHNILPRRKDKHTVGFAVIDLQRTFCLKNGELTLEPASVEDSKRICEFTYRNTRIISNLMATLDTHFMFQIFHPPFWLDGNGSYVAPLTVIETKDILSGKYRVNPEMAYAILGNMQYLGWLQEYVIEYTRKLAEQGKPPLVVWPVHGLFGSPGHSLVPAFQTACQMHELARYARTNYRLKGDKPLSEHYSPFGTEVVEVTVHNNQMTVGELSDRVVDDLLKNIILILAGEASSHCVGSGIYDVLKRIKAQDPNLAKKVYILKDCTSPVPGFEAQADKAFDEFENAGMHLVDSTTPMDEWPDVPDEVFKQVA